MYPRRPAQRRPARAALGPLGGRIPSADRGSRPHRAVRRAGRGARRQAGGPTADREHGRVLEPARSYQLPRERARTAACFTRSRTAVPAGSESSASGRRTGHRGGTTRRPRPRRERATRTRPPPLRAFPDGPRPSGAGAPDRRCPAKRIEPTGRRLRRGGEPVGHHHPRHVSGSLGRRRGNPAPPPCRTGPLPGAAGPWIIPCAGRRDRAHRGARPGRSGRAGAARPATSRRRSRGRVVRDRPHHPPSATPAVTRSAWSMKRRDAGGRVRPDNHATPMSRAPRTSVISR